jgi:hypothetical protein
MPLRVPVIVPLLARGRCGWMASDWLGADLRLRRTGRAGSSVQLPGR